MNSRERFRAAASSVRSEPVPVMYWLNPHTGMKMICEVAHSSDPGLNAMAEAMYRPFGAGEPLDDATRLAPLLLTEAVGTTYAADVGSDVLHTSAGIDFASGVDIFEVDGRLRIRDPLGAVRAPGDGIFADVVEPAVRTVGELDALALPPLDLDALAGTVAAVRERHPEHAVMASCFGVQDLTCTQVWRMDEYMTALVTDAAAIHRWNERFCAYNAEAARAALRGGADAVLIYDDYGHQGGLQISPAMWEEMTYPYLCRLIDAIHGAGGLAVLHSCGYQMPLLGHYADAGLDYLQAFQLTAGNDLAAAVRDYGRDLAFVTGIDVQSFEGRSPGEVRDDILHCWRTGREGRFVLGTTHMLQWTAPVENIGAMLEVVREIRDGEID